VFAYFGLTAEESALVRETVDVLMPSIRPRSFKSLDTPAQHRAKRADLQSYAKSLGEALTSWRKRTHGRGRFDVRVILTTPNRVGSFGIVRISYAESPTNGPKIVTTIDDELVLTTLDSLRTAGLRTIPAGDALALVPDGHLWIDGALYLVRSLARRSWTIRQALRDAEQIVRSVQERSGELQTREVA
jgi:hypothetical protein